MFEGELRAASQPAIASTRPRSADHFRQPGSAVALPEPGACRRTRGSMASEEGPGFRPRGGDLEAEALVRLELQLTGEFRYLAWLLLALGVLGL